MPDRRKFNATVVDLLLPQLALLAAFLVFIEYHQYGYSNPEVYLVCRCLALAGLAFSAVCVSTLLIAESGPTAVTKVTKETGQATSPVSSLSKPYLHAPLIATLLREILAKKNPLSTCRR